VALSEKALQTSTLSNSHLTAVQDATVLLFRFFFDAVNDLSKGVPIEETWMAEYLPTRYLELYDEAFARQFLTCLLTVSAKLWSGEAYRPACVAEQLAFRALLDFAQATLEERGIEPDFGPAWEAAFDDLGVTTLFEESSVVDPRLEFEQWFRPIAEAGVHPSIRFQDRVLTRIS